MTTEGQPASGSARNGPNLFETYAFNRYLRYEELRAWLESLRETAPDLVELETYGRSHEGRPLLLATVTDQRTGAAADKPAHWVDASIHAVELTATVAACHLLHHLVIGARDGDPEVLDALRTRAFYVVPRVNPDGAELVLSDRPRFPRSSTRPWPWRDGQRWPGLHEGDIDGDGRILQMRLADPDGAWMPHPDAPALLVPVPPEGAAPETPRYRLLTEGEVVDFDGFTIPTPAPPEGLDLNRNFPAAWATSVKGSGDHPLSEPEIDALVRAISARPNICGYHAFHTAGGVLLRPSSIAPDSTLNPTDLWVFTQLGEQATECTGYPVHSVYEDFTWDRSRPMGGAADDWVFDHLGIYGWTTEFWDPVHVATGTKQSTYTWYVGPTEDELVAVYRWCQQHHRDGYVAWYPYEHHQLGPVELGGWDHLHTWVNPPAHRLRAEVAAHATAVIRQARSSPRLEVRHERVDRLGEQLWRVEVGVANTGWLPTTVSEYAASHDLVRPLTAEITAKLDPGQLWEVVDGPARRRAGQLAGRAAMRFRSANDGTPDRVLISWTVRAAVGTELTVTARHDRAGIASVTITVG